MSTPSVTILKNLVLNWESNQMEEETIATFYRHYDGSGGFLATRTAPRRMVTVSSRQMRPPNTSARWMGAGRSVHSSVRNTATTISLITKMTAIRRFQAT